MAATKKGRKKKAVFVGTAALILFALVSYFAQEPQKLGAAAPPIDEGTVIPNPMVYTHSLTKDAYSRGVADNLLAIQIDIANGDSVHAFKINNAIPSFSVEQCQAVKKRYPGFDQLNCEAEFNRLFGYPSAFAPVKDDVVLGLFGVRQIKSGRATFFRSLDFAITIATAAVPFKGFVGRDGQKAIAVAAGVGVPALKQLFPDISPGQLQRLQADLYTDVIVPPNSSVTRIVFIPAGLVFSKDTWKLYKQDKSPIEGLKLKQSIELFISASVEGVFITTTPPQIFRGRRF